MTYDELLRALESSTSGDILKQDITVVDKDGEVFKASRIGYSDTVCPGILDDGHLVIVL